MDTLSIKKGRIIIYRLFDVASEINLSLVESQTREGARRLRLSKYPSTKAIEFANPPVSLELHGFTKPLFGQDTKVNVTARAYDFGVISIAFDIPIPQETAFTELETVTKALDTDDSIDKKVMEYIDNLIGTLGDAVIGPGRCVLRKDLQDCDGLVQKQGMGRQHQGKTSGCDEYLQNAL
ncbi:MAG: hypothetical protein HZC48_10450 [Nitrospirae bacterium]|nr:hypothetical protein [Nitrospirota bacterium]